MPTSVRGSERLRGFTLIEILVTLVIMGLLAGLAALSVGGTAERAARDEADRLLQLLFYASDEATMQGEELGLLVEEESYRILRLDPETETWQAASEKPFGEHTLPGGLTLEIELGDAPRAGRAGSDPENPVPGILLLSSGEISAFRMDFRLDRRPEPVAIIESDGSGSLTQR
jgi:general secretion pathway protein H